MHCDGRVFVMLQRGIGKDSKVPQRDGTDGNEMELTAGIKVTGAMAPGFSDILTPEALHFVAGLERRFSAERKRLIEARSEFQQRL
ncbi:uncharacterized protein METZ01_LOCUS376177, partial [marine metagenome]